MNLTKETTLPQTNLTSSFVIQKKSSSPPTNSWQWKEFIKTVLCFSSNKTLFFISNVLCWNYIVVMYNIFSQIFIFGRIG